ncbi:hypothetical protein lerEdw1_012992 [Lerista edwardsae]|nr:hypothetical protein lerEdw1_012992 [Lerista edwardsae]
MNPPRHMQAAQAAGSLSAVPDGPSSEGEEARPRAPNWTQAELVQLYQWAAVDPGLALGWGRGTQYTRRRAAFFDAIGAAVSAQSLHFRSGKACHKRLIDTLGPLRKAARAALATGVDYDTAVAQALKEGQEPLGILLHQDLLKDQGVDTLAGTPLEPSSGIAFASSPLGSSHAAAFSLALPKEEPLSPGLDGNNVAGCSSQEVTPILLLPKEEPSSPSLDGNNGPACSGAAPQDEKPHLEPILDWLDEPLFPAGVAGTPGFPAQVPDEEPAQTASEEPVVIPVEEPAEVPAEVQVEIPAEESAKVLPERPRDMPAQEVAAAEAAAAAAAAAALPAADQVEAPRILPRARGPRSSQQLPPDVASLWGRIEQARIEGGQLWQQAADASRAGQAQVVRALSKVVEQQEELLAAVAQQERVLARQERTLGDVAALIREQNLLLAENNRLLAIMAGVAPQDAEWDRGRRRGLPRRHFASVAGARRLRPRARGRGVGR